nr:hypothetical protein B0A51_09380 [Rachicladosporium sp. CCFEE 5018]
MSVKTLGLATLLAGAANAFWRMPCGGRLLLERADPIVNPGAVAGHVHTISGGNGFGFAMDFNQARASTCSSCPIQADLSNYWTPKLYCHAQNGSFIDVPQAGEYNGRTGGMTVYYQQRYRSDNKSLEAFPAGFRMLAGDPFQRNYTGLQAAPGNAVSFVCLDYKNGSPQVNAIPNKNCPDGLRAQIYFPSCWNGELDSSDHRSHVAYPIGSNTYDNGDCPATHPRRLVSIFYEVIYSIDSFKDDWYGSDHPFVFAQGDRTGYGFHGDFVNGWDVPTLQKAVDTCTNDSGNIEDCHVFDNKLFTSDDQQSCRIPPSVNAAGTSSVEQTTGVLEALPGCNTVTSGPERAVPATNCPKATIGQPATFYTDVTASLDWYYAGCATDNYYTRTFTGASQSSDTMTVATCVKFCKSKGYSLAGLEWSRECYCDNKYRSDDHKPKAGVMGSCDMKCSGDSEEYCGAGGALSVYAACTGSTCQNVKSGVVGNSTSTAESKMKTKRHLGVHRHGLLHSDA